MELRYLAGFLVDVIDYLVGVIVVHVDVPVGVEVADHFEGALAFLFVANVHSLVTMIDKGKAIFGR